jgi:hypothetical protein
MADRFDSISRAASDADEAPDPAEEALLESGVDAPEIETADDEPFGRGEADAVIPNQHLLPQELRKARPQPAQQSKPSAQRNSPDGSALKQFGSSSPAAKAPAQPATTEQIGAAIAEVTGSPISQVAPEVSPQSEPTPAAADGTQTAALHWQRPDFRAYAEQALAEKRQQDPEPPKEERTEHLEWQLREQGRQLEGLQMERELIGIFDSGTRALDFVKNQETQWAAAHPDYSSRIVFVRDRRDRDLQRMGYADPAVRQRILAEEGAMVMAHALKQGRNPAQVVHDLAEMWGFGSRGM